MELSIEIDSWSRDVAWKLFPDAETIGSGAEHQLAPEISLVCSGLTVRKGEGVPGTTARVVSSETVKLAAKVAGTIAVSVAATLIANWIWESVKDSGVKQIRIERQVVELDQGEITRIIQEKMEMQVQQ